jgi:hypothetical protein
VVQAREHFLLGADEDVTHLAVVTIFDQTYARQDREAAQPEQNSWPNPWTKGFLPTDEGKQKSQPFVAYRMFVQAPPPKLTIAK